MEERAQFPHGRCECDGPTCCGGAGPAAYRVTRAGRSMRVCTKCDLSGDTEKTLLVTQSDPTAPYRAFDPFGFFCLLGQLAGAEARDASA